MPRTFPRITVFVALFLLAQTIPVGAMAASANGPIPGGLDGNQPAASQNPGQPDTPKRIKDPKPYRGTAEWDPRDPAAVQYADGAWGVAYNDNANPPNLFFRRTLGGEDPEYWRDAVTIEAGAERPAMTRLGNSTALFYGKLVGTVREVFVKTSTDDGATWSAASQLTTGSPANVFHIDVANVAGTVYLFWSRSDTTGVVQYRTSTDLTSWSASTTVGEPVGPLQANTYPYFDIESLSAGGWAMAWINISQNPASYPGTLNLSYPVVWFGTSSDLASWSGKQELTATYVPWEQYHPEAVSVSQASSGDIHLTYNTFEHPIQEYVMLRSSADGGATWSAAVKAGDDPAQDPNAGDSGATYARNPYGVRDLSGEIRLFWDQQVTTPFPGAYPAQLFRRQLPAGPITQISVSKDQKAKCGPCVPSGAFVADPVNATTGNFTLPETDVAIPGKGPGLLFARAYNAQRTVDGPLGFGWTHNFGEHLQTFSRGEVLVVDGSGRNDLYTPKAGGGYDPPPGRFGTLVQHLDQTWTLTETDFTKKTFTSGGVLSSIADRNSNTLILSYDAQARLQTVTDASGRTLTFGYTGNRTGDGESIVSAHRGKPRRGDK